MEADPKAFFVKFLSVSKMCNKNNRELPDAKGFYHLPPLAAVASDMFQAIVILLALHLQPGTIVTLGPRPRSTPEPGHGVHLALA